MAITSAGDGDAPENITLDRGTGRAERTLAVVCRLAAFFALRVVVFLAMLLFAILASFIGQERSYG